MKLLAYFLKDRMQRVVLNGQVSNWLDVTAGVPQGSILCPFLFLIYINDLATGLSSNAKLFADDTSLFSVTHSINKSANELNNDLPKINNWAFQWKMNFNPSPTKQTQKSSSVESQRKQVTGHYFSITLKFHNLHLRKILVL